MKFILMLICILGIKSAYSAPEIVYRVDARSPDIIFNNGFTAWGTNTDLFEHIGGSSIIMKNSAFIATTENLQFTKTFLLSYETHIQYIYAIYTDEHFYSVNTSLKYVIENHRGYVEQILETANTLYRTFRHENEFVAEHKIAPSNIISVDAYEWDQATHSLKLVYTKNNPLAKKPDSVATDNPYIFTPKLIDEFHYTKKGCNVLSDDSCSEENEQKSFLSGFCNGLPILSSPYNKPVTSCNSFTSIQPAINLLLSSPPPALLDWSGFPFSTYMTCYSGGILAYDHLSCTNDQGIDFEGNLGGFGGLSGFSGTMYFNKGYKYFKGKSCSVSYNDYIVYAVLDINCYNGLNAHLEDISSPSLIVTGGSGSFS